jgi:hypothetical protein
MSCLLANSFNSSTISSGSRNEILFVEDLRFGSVVLSALLHSICSFESALDQNSLSLSSFPETRLSTIDSAGPWPGILPGPEKAKNYPGSFSKWWTAVTSGMYITLNLAQKLNETLLGMR